MRIYVNNLAAPKGSTERNTVLEARRLGLSEDVHVAAIWENHHGGITVNLWGSFVVRSDQLTDSPVPPVFLVLVASEGRNHAV